MRGVTLPTSHGRPDGHSPSRGLSRHDSEKNRAKHMLQRVCFIYSSAQLRDRLWHSSYLEHRNIREERTHVKAAMQKSLPPCCVRERLCCSISPKTHPTYPPTSLHTDSSTTPWQRRSSALCRVLDQRAARSSSCLAAVSLLVSAAACARWKNETKRPNVNEGVLVLVCETVKEGDSEVGVTGYFCGTEGGRHGR